MRRISRKIKFVLVLFLMLGTFLLISFLNSFNNKEGIEVEHDFSDKSTEEFDYSYFNTDLASKEKEVFDVAKEEITKTFGENHYNNEKPFKVRREKFKESYWYSFLKEELDLQDDEYVWHVSGSLYCYKQGSIFKKRVTENCLGGVIEVMILDKDLKVLNIFHSK